MPIVGCDVDGVVADFVEGMIAALDLDKKKEDFVYWDLSKNLTTEEWEKARQKLRDPEFWYSLPLVDGAKSKVKELKGRGFKFTWITSPWQSCIGWDTARREWLAEHFGDDATMITPDKGKPEFHKTINVDIFIDDKPANVDASRKGKPNRKTFLYDAPYNRGYDLVPRVTWGTIDWVT